MKLVACDLCGQKLGFAAAVWSGEIERVNSGKETPPSFQVDLCDRCADKIRRGPAVIREKPPAEEVTT